MSDEDDIIETKPSILSLLNRLYEQPTLKLDNEDDRQESPESERSYVNHSLTDVRTTLEDRFLELVQQYPCFYDPNDKNFVHNQHKSNTYAIIAKKLCSEGLETTGTQLATLFKSMKAKYREESRRIARAPDLEPSPFFKKLAFLESGLNSVDQRLAKFRATNGIQKPSSSSSKEIGREKYVTVIANALDKFSPEMKEGFLKFITALNDLNEPIKQLEQFTRIARELKSKPNSTVEVVMQNGQAGYVNRAEQRSPSLLQNSQLASLVPDLESIGQAFEGQKDLLALFRVLGNAATKLPKRRRHSHLQGLLNISSAALNTPVQISWNSEVYNSIEKSWSTVNNSITIDGPSPNELKEVGSRQKEASVEMVPPEPKRSLKRKRQSEPIESENEDDDSEIMSVVTDESSVNGKSDRRLPRAAKKRIVSSATQQQPASVRSCRRR